MHDLLRERIVTLAIPPGETIRQDALAHELGVSKIPVREALSRLEVAGLVQYVTNRGFATVPLTVEELDDIFHLRLLVEPATAAIGAERADEQAREAVRGAAAELAAAGSSLANTARQRKALLLAFLAPARRPATEYLVRRMFYLAERYLPESPDARGMNEGNLDALAEAWLKAQAPKVEQLYSDRLRHRSSAAKAMLTARASP